ncbi:endonuclease VII domain-containing protein [Xanthomonas citri pv. citri]
MASRRGKDPKVCNGCKVAKPRAEFYPNGKGVSSKCRECVKIESTQRQRRDPAAARDACKRSKMKVQYGMTLEQYDAKLKAQGGACAICGSTDPKGNGRFAIDHCHMTGKVRAILCAPCNQGLGMFDDNIEKLAEAIAYLQRWSS